MVEQGRRHETTFYADGRATWRVTWVLGLGVLLVCVLMQANGAWLWPIFSALSLLLLGVGGAALHQRANAVCDIETEGLRIHAGVLGLGGGGDAASFVLPWNAIGGMAFEHRQVGRRMYGLVLAFHLAEAVQRPDGHRGFLAKLAQRTSQWAVGEHFVWNPDTRKLDLHTLPRGGHAKLTAAIARLVPALGDPSQERRQGLGGPVAYALFDLALAAAVLTSLALVATGHTEVFGELARRAFAWGGSVPIGSP